MAHAMRDDTRVFPGEDRAFVWFVRNRFLLLEALVREARDAPRDPRTLAPRFERALRHARRLLALRLAVTILLAFGLVASLVSVLTAALGAAGFQQGADLAQGWVARVAALSTSLAIALLALRFALERALTRYDIVAQFLAARLT